ncbi:MAG: 2-hydroxyacyl-CoA dehydratase, partial [Alphaproteobacteria bacterium]
MMREYFENLAASLENKIQQQPDLPHARRRFALATVQLGRRLFTAGEKTAWCGVLAPFDLLNAMGVNSCFVEFVGAMLASNGTAAGFLNQAENAGYFTDSCAYHRAVTGATLQGLMPEPDFLIATTTPCTGGLAVIENMARHYRKDLFVLHLPYDRGERSVQHLADQLRRMVDFVAAHTGEPLDPARLRTAMEKTNRARELIMEVYELAKRDPSPVQSKDLKDFAIVSALFLGTDTAIEITQAFK